MSHDPTDRRADLAALAETAFVWGSALIGATRVRQNLTQPLDPHGPRPASSAGGPINNLAHQRALSDPRFTVGVAPNVDTLYSLAWLDLATGPYVFETPDLGDRYHTFQLAHADGETAWSPGQRSHGSQLPPLLIHGPTWSGAVPDGVVAVAARTRYFMIAGRVLVEPGVPGDTEVVHRLQDAMELRPLTRWLADEHGPNAVSPQVPLPTAAEIPDPTLRFLHELGCVLREGVVADQELPLVASLAPLGLSVEGGFTPDLLTEDDLAAIARGVASGDRRVEEKIGDLGTSANGWSTNLLGPAFDGDHLLRAAVARNQIYVVPADEAIYPVARVDAHGETLDGHRRYLLHFEEPPPAGCFWSLTVYAKPGRLVPNPLDRYAIGDRTPGLRTADDGSLTVHLSQAEPSDGTANWLPLPDGPFHVMLRLYGPAPEALEGRWAPPPIRPLSSSHSSG